MRAIAVVYDGSTPAGTIGTIDLGIASGGEIAAFQALAQVNVYVTDGPAPDTWFAATVTAANARGDSLELDHPLLNGRPKLRVLAMHFHQGRGWNHPVATHYDVSARRWRVRNEDGATMPLGEAFVVRIDPSALKLRTSNASQRFIRIEHPSSDHNPYAVIVATPWSSGSRRMTQPYSVAYVAPHWLIIPSDGRDFPSSSRWRRTQASGFFVKVMGAGQYVDATLPADPSGFRDTYLSNGAGIDLVGRGAAWVSGATKWFRGFCWTTDVTIPALATLNQTPLPPPAPRNYNWTESKFIGVTISANAAAVVHEDGSTLDPRTPYNVWGPYRVSCPPH